MNTSAAQSVLPKDPYAIIAEQHAVILQLTRTVEKLQGELSELRRMLFGKSSERLPRVLRELKKRRRNNGQPLQEASAQVIRDKRANTERLKKELPTEDVSHAVTLCPHCQSTELIDLKSPEVSDEIEYVRAHFIRRRHMRDKKKCLQCQSIVCSPPPPRVADNTLFGPKLHAHVVVRKNLDAIPLYRQAAQLQRDGLPIDDTTLGRMYHRSAELLEPIAKRILELVVAAPYVNADETPVFIQHEETCKKGFMWTFLTEGLIGYVFSPSRSGETPKRFLEGTQGHLQVDGFGAYNVVCTPDSRQRVGCLGHIRRKFFNAQSYAPEAADHALELILSMYEVEYDAALQKILGTSKHKAMRKLKTKKHLDALIQWTTEWIDAYPPQSPMGKAIGYAHKNLPLLKPVIQDARLRLDNNVAENALRIIALGRKNYLFVGNEQSGENLAVLQTIIATCMAQRINPEIYIADVLMKLDSTKASQIDDLLPMAWSKTQQSTSITGTQ